MELGLGLVPIAYTPPVVHCRKELDLLQSKYGSVGRRTASLHTARMQRCDEYLCPHPRTLVEVKHRGDFLARKFVDACVTPTMDRI